MRLRFAVLASLLTVLVAVAVPGVASAAPRHNHGLTINAIPRSITAGEGVLIYGQLKGGTVADQPIVLYHHLADSGRGYTRVAETTTDSRGFYEFIRAEDVVLTNRSWFVTGPNDTHSRTVFERVAALVSAPTTSTAALDTNHPVVFTGHVTPNHAFERVLLQAQNGSGDDWTTLKAGRLGPGSNYSIAYRFRVPGERDLRVVFPGDDRNTRGISDPTAVTIQQAQVPGFTIATSAPIIGFGDSARISGVLDQPGTTTPEPNTAVVLCGRTATQAQSVCDQVTTTGTDGSYGFTVAPAQNELYYVRTSLPPKRHTALLFEGVRDLVTMTPSDSTTTIGKTVTFTGTVTPDKAGHVIYLQRMGKDDEWHTVEVRFVRSNSTFQFTWTFGDAGTQVFRARITSDKHNVGGASAPVSITVNPAPASSLVPAS
jgi:hypothetical protein